MHFTFCEKKMKIGYPFPLKNLTIRLKRSGCLGPCPVYELIIHGNGEVIYNGEYFVKEIGIRKDKISQSQIFTLFKYAIKIGFFELKSEYNTESYYELDKNGMVQYSESMITDLPTYEVEIKIGNKKKEIIDYLGAPKRLRQFENMIDKICKSERWIGKNNKQIWFNKHNKIKI